DRALSTDVGEMADGRPVPAAEVQDRRRVVVRPNSPAALEVRRQLAPIHIPSPIFDPSLQMKALSVDRNARVQIPREKPRAVRVNALPFGGTNLHRLSDGTSHLEASARPVNPTSPQSLAQRSSEVWALIVSGGTKRSSSRAWSDPWRGTRRRGCSRRPRVQDPVRALPARRRSPLGCGPQGGGRLLGPPRRSHPSNHVAWPHGQRPQRPRNGPTAPGRDLTTGLVRAPPDASRWPSAGPSSLRPRARRG